MNTKEKPVVGLCSFFYVYIMLIMFNDVYLLPCILWADFAFSVPVCRVKYRNIEHDSGILLLLTADRTFP